MLPIAGVSKSVRTNYPDGYYWVRYKGVWYIARWHTAYKDDIGESGDFLMTGTEQCFQPYDFEEINETRILPPEN